MNKQDQKVKKPKRAELKEPKKTITTPYFPIGNLPKTWRINNLLNFERAYVQSLICNGYSFRSDLGRTPKLPIKIPLKLKKIILDDWGLVSYEKAKVHLPRNPSINKIIADYLEILSREVELQKLPQIILDLTLQFMNGLKSQFTQLIRSKFLFYAKFQIQDYEVKQSLGAPVQIYGLEHLLRYLVQIPRIFSSYSYNYRYLRTLYKLVQLFLSYLCKFAELYQLNIE